MDKSIDELVVLIDKWHKDRKITINGNVQTQTIKLIEEFGELGEAIVKKDHAGVKDSLGDMFVVMVAIAKLSNTNMNECIDIAYNEIKDRTGYLNSLGNFIKDDNES